MLSLNLRLYRSWINIHYATHLSSYVAELVSKRGDTILNDIALMRRNHPEYQIQASAPVHTSRGYEATVIITSSTWEVEHA